MKTKLVGLPPVMVWLTLAVGCGEGSGESLRPHDPVDAENDATDAEPDVELVPVGTFHHARARLRRVVVHDAGSYMASRADLASAIATAFEHTALGGSRCSSRTSLRRPSRRVPRPARAM